MPKKPAPNPENEPKRGPGRPRKIIGAKTTSKKRSATPKNSRPAAGVQSVEPTRAEDTSPDLADGRRLTMGQKHFVVESLACGRYPHEVVEAVKERFGIDVSIQRIECYDPTKVAGRSLSMELQLLFVSARDKYVAEMKHIAVSHQVWRVDLLDRLVARTYKKGNVPLTAELLEQAAREVGGMYTNARVFSGPNNGPIEVRTSNNVDAATKIQNLMRRGKERLDKKKRAQ